MCTLWRFQFLPCSVATRKNDCNNVDGGSARQATTSSAFGVDPWIADWTEQRLSTMQAEGLQYVVAAFHDPQGEWRTTPVHEATAQFKKQSALNLPVPSTE